MRIWINFTKAHSSVCESKMSQRGLANRSESDQKIEPGEQGDEGIKPPGSYTQEADFV